MSTWDKADTRVAAYVITHDEEGRVLLVRTPPHDAEPGHWTVPGGEIELDERPEAAAVREVREETGLEVRLTGLLGVDQEWFPPEVRHDLATCGGRWWRTVRIVYAGEVVGGELTAEADGMTETPSWVERSQALRDPHVSLVAVALRLDRPAE